MKAVCRVFKRQFLFADLKLENVLITSTGHVKLADFGLARAYRDLEAAESAVENAYCGTVESMAPEVVKRSPQGYTRAVDWWSYGKLNFFFVLLLVASFFSSQSKVAGVIAFELLTGCSPFTIDGNHNSAQEVARYEHFKIMFICIRRFLCRRILTKPVPYPKTMDSTSKNFIAALLNRNVSQRLGANGITELKAHAFFAGIDWEQVEQCKLISPVQPVINGKASRRPECAPTDAKNVRILQADVNNFAIEFTAQVGLLVCLQSGI